MDLNRMSELLRRLTARQEKVVRLYFGLGCQRPHSAQEIAEEFGVSPRTIACTLRAAMKKLAPQGLTSEKLREAVLAGAGASRAQRPYRCRGSEAR